MNINTERKGKTLIARPAGKIEGTNAEEFHQELMGNLDENDQAIILNLGDITYISSAGLRIIAMANNHAQSNSMRFMLCNPNIPVKAVFTTSGLNRLIQIHDSELEALRAAGGA